MNLKTLISVLSPSVLLGLFLLGSSCQIFDAEQSESQEALNDLCYQSAQRPGVVEVWLDLYFNGAEDIHSNARNALPRQAGRRMGYARGGMMTGGPRPGAGAAQGSDSGNDLGENSDDDSSGLNDRRMGDRRMNDRRMNDRLPPVMDEESADYSDSQLDHLDPWDVADLDSRQLPSMIACLHPSDYNHVVGVLLTSQYLFFPSRRARVRSLLDQIHQVLLQRSIENGERELGLWHIPGWVVAGYMMTQVSHMRRLSRRVVLPPVPTAPRTIVLGGGGGSGIPWWSRMMFGTQPSLRLVARPRLSRVLGSIPPFLGSVPPFFRRNLRRFAPRPVQRFGIAMGQWWRKIMPLRPHGPFWRWALFKGPSTVARHILHRIAPSRVSRPGSLRRTRQVISGHARRQAQIVWRRLHLSLNNRWTRFVGFEAGLAALDLGWQHLPDVQTSGMMSTLGASGAHMTDRVRIDPRTVLDSAENSMGDIFDLTGVDPEVAYQEMRRVYAQRLVSLADQRSEVARAARAAAVTAAAAITTEEGNEMDPDQVDQALSAQDRRTAEALRQFGQIPRLRGNAGAGSQQRAVGALPTLGTTEALQRQIPEQLIFDPADVTNFTDDEEGDWDFLRHSAAENVARFIRQDAIELRHLLRENAGQRMVENPLFCWPEAMVQEVRSMSPQERQEELGHFEPEDPRYCFGTLVERWNSLFLQNHGIASPDPGEAGGSPAQAGRGFPRLRPFARENRAILGDVEVLLRASHDYLIRMYETGADAHPEQQRRDAEADPGVDGNGEYEEGFDAYDREDDLNPSDGPRGEVDPIPEPLNLEPDRDEQDQADEELRRRHEQEQADRRRRMRTTRRRRR